VFTEIDRINSLMSTYLDDSQISAINRDAAAAPVDAGPELFQLILRSLDISVLTRGAFDITYDSVGQHYDFREEQRPDPATVTEELKSINYRLVRMNRSNNSISFDRPGVLFNLGGIAKGYSVERGVKILQEYGVRHGRVTAGGDTRLLGDWCGKPWMVGIRSATVVGPDAVITDALSTSVFVMGVDRGLRLIATLADYEGIVIDAMGRLYYSDGFRPPETSNIETE